MATFSVSFICVLFVQLCVIAHCAVDFQVVGNSHGFTELIVSNNNTVIIPNRQRPTHQPSIKLSFTNEIIEKVHQINSTAWSLEFSDLSKRTPLRTFLEIDTQTRLATGLQEYRFIWHGVRHRPELQELCFHVSFNNASWYHTHQNAKPDWPMGGQLTRFSANLNSIASGDDYRFQDLHLISGQLFLNTDGFAVLMDAYQEIFYIRNFTSYHEEYRTVCFQAENEMSWRIFAGSNVKTVYETVANRLGYIPRPSSVPDEWKFSYPTFWYKSYQDGTIIEFADKLEKHGFNNVEILIRDGDSKLLNETIMSNLHRRKFRVGLGVSSAPPTITDHTKQYLVEGLWSNIVDFSNPEACHWFQSSLSRLHYELGVDSFYIEAGVQHPKNASQLHDPMAQQYPVYLDQKYIECVAGAGVPTVSAIGYNTQKLSAFVQQYAYVATSATIGGVLSLSLGGYSFVVPSPIDHPENHNPPMGAREGWYWQMLKITAFMPSMSFETPPWIFNNETLVNATRKYIALHTEHVPLMLELAKKRVRDGSPIIRPMWYAEPEDERTYQISNQFMLGDDIVVAVADYLSMKLYLPSGEWLDQHGKNFHGPGLFENVMTQDELCYYKRKH